MDCTKTKEYLECKSRMANYCNDSKNCISCPLSSYNNGTNIGCTQFESENRDESIQIVQKWADENMKTLKDVLLGNFPNTSTHENGVPVFCPNTIFNIERICGGMSCKECWDRYFEEGML